MTSRRTYSVREDRQIKLERIALEVSKKSGKIVTWTKIMEHLIDNYAKDAGEDLKNEIKNEEKI